MGFCVFCAHNTAATRGQYLALSKAWHYLFSYFSVHYSNVRFYFCICKLFVTFSIFIFFIPFLFIYVVIVRATDGAVSRSRGQRSRSQNQKAAAFIIRYAVTLTYDLLMPKSNQFVSVPGWTEVLAQISRKQNHEATQRCLHGQTNGRTDGRTT